MGSGHNSWIQTLNVSRSVGPLKFCKSQFDWSSFLFDRLSLTDFEFLFLQLVRSRILICINLSNVKHFKDSKI